MGILTDKYRASQDIEDLEKAVKIADWLIENKQDGSGAYIGPTGDYTSVIYPAKSIMELMYEEKALAESEREDRDVWQERYDRHFNSVKKAMDIVASIKVAPLFEAYLSHGYYPFYRESLEDFPSRLRETVTVVIDSDLPAVENVTYETLQKAKKLLMIISEHVPFEPNMSALWRQLSTDNESGLKMLYSLDKAQVLALLTAKTKNYKSLTKPDKIFLGNPNLMHALCPKVDKGNERETFFISQLRVLHDVHYPKQGDFFIDDRYLFEVGGKGKTFEQIADLPDSYLAVDDTEVGSGSRIPLWLFGFLY